MFFFLSSLVCKINSRQHKIQENSEFEFIPSSANKHCKRETWKGKNTIANDSHHTKKSFILIEQVLNMDSLPRSISFYCLVRVQEDLELTPPRAKDKKKSKLNCRTIPDPNRSLHIDRASFNNEFNRRKFHQNLNQPELFEPAHRRQWTGRKRNVLKNFDFIDSDNFK